MVSTSNSEIKGTFQETPIAELLAEAGQSKISGSFRFAHDDSKTVVYLDQGSVVFAVSNLRQHRLFSLLLQTGQITAEKLKEIPEFTNDLVFARKLVDDNVLSKKVVQDLTKSQIREIIKTALAWEKGAWSFSHLARVKENMRYDIDLTEVLLDYARKLTDEFIIKRFRSFEEKFALREDFTIDHNLFPPEGFIYSRLSKTPVKIQEIRETTGFSDVETLRTLYILWISKFVVRKHWNSVFSEQKLQKILSTNLILRKEAEEIVVEKEAGIEIVKDVVEGSLPAPIPVEIDIQKELETYLERVENAESYYEILDVPTKASLAEIKTSYFGLAKNYHPDKFHQETDPVLQQRVQNAFTELARAYETLKDDDSRELYDFKLRKYLESVEYKTKASGSKKSAPATNLDRAREEFDQGFDLLLAEEYEAAAPYLARAVQLSPDLARYHAYYGKALSFVDNQRFKAEAEIRQAMKLDANNPNFWLMLAEFYVQFNLLKRAEGELRRLLAQFPENREAQTLLESLPGK